MNNFSAFGRGLIGWNKRSSGLEGGSKNPIRQVVSHELKINGHGFPVSPPSPLFIRYQPFIQCFLWQKASVRWKKIWKKKRETKKKRRTDQNTHPNHGMAVIQRCFHNVLPSNFFSSERLREVWIRWQTGENVAETPQPSCVSELSQSPETLPAPTATRAVS